MDIRVAHLILFEIANHPVCAATERDLLIEAQPPLLEKEGNGAATTPATRLQALPDGLLNNTAVDQHGQIIASARGPFLYRGRPWLYFTECIS